MRYTLTFREQDYENLVSYLFSDRTVERAAFALCKVSIANCETRLLLRELILVAEDEIEEASSTNVKIISRSFTRAIKRADDSKQVFLFIHSHPPGVPNHSRQDDIEEKKLFKTAYIRIRTRGVHGSLVLSSPDKPIGRVWLESGITKPIDMIRVIGNKFRFFTNLEKNSRVQFFDRQIRAFGQDIQSLLRQLHIGIIGVGGTGSSVAEQLIRLGVGSLTISDGQRFEKTNINRVYGSKITDNRKKKVKLVRRLAKNIGLGTKITSINRPIIYRSVVNKIKNCDVIFGCTDDHWGRSILNRVATYYLIPVFDMGVKIDSKNETIRSVQGRVTTLLGGYACLFCRGRVDPKRIECESLAAVDPRRLAELRREGYIPELEETAPAVISFTTTIAATAVSEFLHRLTGYMGADRISNETLMLFDQSKVRTNRRLSKEECFCGDDYHMLRGDVTPLLDMTWPKEK